MRLLLVEDDRKTSAFLKKGLSEEGYVVDIFHDGASGLEHALSGDYQLIILDVMLPEMEGWEVLAHLRRQGSTVPVLMLTAMDAVQHRIRGLSSGADDYLVKPFAFGELIARIRAVTRRKSEKAEDVLSYEDLRLDRRAAEVTRASELLTLTVKEFTLLELFLERQGEVLTRTLIAEAVWDMAFDMDSNVIDVSIRRLRCKVDDPFERKLIHTVRGRGYVLR